VTPGAVRSITTAFALAAAVSALATIRGAAQQQPPAAPPPPPQERPAQPPPPPTGQRGQTPSFTAAVDVVSLNVTVTDPTAHYLTDLEPDAFTIFEDGVKQDILYFNRTNLPMALSLLVDTSASMEDKMNIVQEAASGFARRIRKQDLAQIIDFDSRAEITQPFTNEVPLLEKAIRQTIAGGSTALHNAIYIALKELKKVKAAVADDVRRQAIVVLSDGEDTSSLIGFEEVLDLAKRSEVAIYTIGIRGRDANATKGFKEAEYVLRTLAQETGGRPFFPSHVDELSGVYSQIADELSSQYSIGYTSKNPKRDGAWRRIVVRVNRPNAQARTKQGYYAPTTH
jgi:Ca-activated chloride channel homolog